MSMVSSVYGRMGSDPQAKTTKTGNAMTLASIAVDVTGKDGEQQTLWVSLLAFGANAESLLRSAKGEMVAAMGRMTRGEYTARTGEVRESWSMLCDSVATTKGAKPPGKARPREQPPQTQSDQKRNEASLQFQDPRPFDDEIPF